MNNAERWKDELHEIADEEYSFGVRNNMPIKCVDETCIICDFFNLTPCNLQRIKWLIAEYQEPRKLTKKEHQFCELLGRGYIARNGYGSVVWFSIKPTLSDNGIFMNDNGIFSVSNDGAEVFAEPVFFSFGVSFDGIKNEECFSVEELLTWDVEEGERDDTV